MLQKLLLSLIDFWLFSLIKRNLNDHYDVGSLKRQITKILREKNLREMARTDATLY